MASNSLFPQSIKAPGLQPISGVVTNQVITKEEGLTADGALHLRVDLKASGVTVVGSITAKLQHKSPGGSYADLGSANASVTISGNGYFSIKLLVERTADQVDMPLKSMVQVVLTTTNAGDAVTIDDIWLTQAR